MDISLQYNLQPGAKHLHRIVINHRHAICASALLRLLFEIDPQAHTCCSSENGITTLIVNFINPNIAPYKDAILDCIIDLKEHEKLIQPYREIA